MSTFFITLLLQVAFALTPTEIIQQSIEKQKLNNSIQTIEMQIISKKGSVRTRRFSLTIRRDDDTLRSFTRFLSPADVAGTSLVMIDRPNQNDPQLLYLPALKRVQRIAGKARKR